MLVCLAALFAGLLILVYRGADKPFIRRVDWAYRYSHIVLGGYDIIVDANFTLRVWESYGEKDPTAVMAVWALVLPWILNLITMAIIMRHEKVCACVYTRVRVRVRVRVS